MEKQRESVYLLVSHNVYSRALSSVNSLAISFSQTLRSILHSCASLLRETPCCSVTKERLRWHILSWTETRPSTAKLSGHGSAGMTIERS